MKARKLTMLLLGAGLTVVLAGILAFVLMPNASQAADTLQVAAVGPAGNVLSGRVYDGQTGVEPPNSTPIQDVTVSLYCSNNQGNQGDFLRSTTTDSTGWYGLDVGEGGCEYYNIIETDPAGYTSDGATTVSGTVVSANWIQYSIVTKPLSEQTLTGNKFWDRGPATDTPTPTTQPTNTPTNTPTSTPTDTPANTPTNQPTSTPTPTGTVILPTRTPTATPTPTATLSPGGFTYSIDPDLRPKVDSLTGIGGRPPRMMAAVLAPNGERDDFAVGQVILYAPEPVILETFAQAYNAEVVLGGKLPDPPDTVPPDAVRGDLDHTDYYLLNVDLGQADMSGFKGWMEELGFDGHWIFSSEEAVRLSAIIAKERVANHLNVTPDMLAQAHTPTCVLCRTEEEPQGSGFRDGFAFNWVHDGNLQLSRAWQYFDLLHLNTRPWLAVLDGGFNLNADFPSNTPQYDLVDEDYNAQGNGGGHSPWHGTGALSMAAARINNRFGSVGTGAQAARPMIFRMSDDGSASFSMMSDAIDLATYWGADVINISYGGECGWWCRNFGIFSGMDSLASSAKSAGLSGVVVVVSAGNSEDDLDGMTYLPCETSWTLCVGAIDTNSKQATRKSTHGWGSNYGSKVNIWAPGDAASLRVTYNPDHLGSLPAFNGTSAASPYIAGIVALMKAVNSGTDYGDAVLALRNTANTSSDGRVVPGYVNAYAALKSVAVAAGRQPVGDNYEPNNSSATAHKLTGTSTVITGTIAPGDHDYFYFEMADFMDVNLTVTYYDLQTPNNGLRVSALGQVAGPSSSGTIALSKQILAPGKHVIEVWGQSADSINCYRLSLSMTLAAIQPDRFDDQSPVGEVPNNTFANRAVISDIVEATVLVPMGTIADVNFHVTGDIDFYDVTLAAETDPVTGRHECKTPPSNDPSFTQGSFTISAMPDVWKPQYPGYNWPFEIRVYDAQGKEYTSYKSKSGYNLTIACPHTAFPDGHVRFSVRAKNGRRNFYRIMLDYRRWDSYPNVPHWVWDLTDPPLINRIVPETGWLEHSFPSDPAVIDQWFNGEAPDPLPAEYGVLDWTQNGPFDAYLSTLADHALEMRLYNGEQQLIAGTAIGGVERLAHAEADEPGHIHLDELPAGEYVFAFGPGDFGTIYSVKVESQTGAVYLPFVTR